MISGRHFDRSVILLCVRWYLAYNLSLRDLEEMMAERGIHVDHSTIHRWIIRFSPLLLERFNRGKRPVTRKWHVDETYVKVRRRWMYLYRAIDSLGDTVEFFFSEHRDPSVAKCFLRKALQRHGRPDRIVIDGSQTNREARGESPSTAAKTRTVNAGFPIAGKSATFHLYLVRHPQPLRPVPLPTLCCRYPKSSSTSHGGMESCNNRLLTTTPQISLHSDVDNVTSPICRPMAGSPKLLE